MITPISSLKRWFANFKKPTQEQFWAWLDSYWHKSEKIPMDTIDGLENAIRGTASADQLRNHLTDSQAHQELFATKVDKEAGKTLTSNDYTNEEKRTNQANAKKRVVNLTVTGDVDKIITITFADGTAIQAPFTDKDTLPENLADIKLNSLNFNHETGVLTGLRSDGQQLTVSLDGRYALLGHTHPEYAYRTHTHSEYAPKGHRHHLDDIDGVPTPLFNKIRNSIYGEILDASSPIKTGELFLENGESKANIWPQGGELHVGSRNAGGYTIIRAFGYKVQGKSIDDVLLADGSTISKGMLLGREGIERYNWTATREYQNSVVFVPISGFIELHMIEHLGSVSFRKVFTGGTVTFTCTGKTIIYTGDNAFNGGDGSTAVVSIYGNKCYIDIRNV